jgi:hypothetical protein
LTADKKNGIRVGREPSRSSIDKVGEGEGKVRSLKLKARGWKIETGRGKDTRVKIKRR